LNVKYYWNNALKIRLIWLLIIIYWIKPTPTGIRLHTKIYMDTQVIWIFTCTNIFSFVVLNIQQKIIWASTRDASLPQTSSWLKFLNQEKSLNSKKIIQAYFGWTYALIHPTRKMFFWYGQMYYYCSPSYLCDTMDEWIFNDKHSNFQWDDHVSSLKHELQQLKIMCWQFFFCMMHITTKVAWLVNLIAIFQW